MHDYWLDRVVVVTGAAQGQGEAEARALYDLGAKVFALDVAEPNDARWAGLRAHADAAPERLTIRCLDVSDPEAWQALADDFRAADITVHGLINNAGVTLRKTVGQTSPEEWRRVLSINLDGAFYGIHFLSRMMGDGGAIVNISSTAGLTGYFGAAYAASKWALRGLTRSAAQELADRNIRVNCICPGLIETPMIRKPNAEHDAGRAALFHEGNRQATLLSRGADPAEVATVAVFLMGPDASFITAADIPVDGGMTGSGIYWRVGKMTGNL